MRAARWHTGRVRALAIVYQSDAGPGLFTEAMRGRGLELEEWLVPERPEPPRELSEYAAVLTFGGAMHADQDDKHPWLRPQKELLAALVEDGTPTLGVCLGAQILASAAGAAPRRLPDPEIGWLDVELTAEGAADPLFSSLPKSFIAFEWHSYEFPLPPGAAPLAKSPLCLQAFRAGDAAWAIQFHPEVTRAEADQWTRDYRDDEDAVRIGLDPRRLTAETADRIEEWNELGRGLAERFAELVTASVPR
jgi:GMP synthase-like glutamine amidotransferase